MTTDHTTNNDGTDTLAELLGDPIHVYTRAHALADGVLVTLPATLTQEAGFCVPIDMTAAAHADTVRWGEDEDQANPGVCQDETGRTWDVLTMLQHATRGRSVRWGDRIPFRLLRVSPTTRDEKPQLVTLHAVFTGDEDCNPTVVLMQPHED